MTAEAAQCERMTVFLIPKVGKDLRRLEERTNLSRTDLANRAITLYEFVDAQLRAGNEMITRHHETGSTKLVQLIGAPAGQAARVGPALSGRGSAAPRHGRLGPAAPRHGRLGPAAPRHGRLGPAAPRHRRLGRLGRLHHPLQPAGRPNGLVPLPGLAAQK